MAEKIKLSKVETSRKEKLGLRKGAAALFMGATALAASFLITDRSEAPKPAVAETECNPIMDDECTPDDDGNLPVLTKPDTTPSTEKPVDSTTTSTTEKPPVDSTTTSTTEKPPVDSTTTSTTEKPNLPPVTFETPRTVPQAPPEVHKTT